jgi:hypothetical protein
MQWHENPTADTYLEFPDTLSALDFLHTFMPDPLSMMTLRHSLTESLSSTNIAGLDDQEILEQLAGRLVDGSIRVMPFAPSQPAIQGSGQAKTATEVAEKDEEEEQATPTAVEQRTSWIEIKLIDEESSPIMGEKYRIVLPDGSITEGQLDSDGKARIEGINPGTCKVSFPGLNARTGLNT